MKWFFLLCSLVLFCPPQAEAKGPSVCFSKGCVDVEVVQTPAEMKRGLQGREELGSNQGMLFIFPKEDIYRFWMKGMNIRIDIIWIDEKKNIVTIAPSRPPCLADPCEIYEPTAKARYVLEVQDGYALRHHLKIGDTLHFYDIH